MFWLNCSITGCSFTKPKILGCKLKYGEASHQKTWFFFCLPAGSCDSCIKLWECGEGFRNLKQLFSVPMVRYSQSNRCIEFGSVYKHAPQALPSPCMAFSQSLSVNSFWWRIQGKRAGNTFSLGPCDLKHFGRITTTSSGKVACITDVISPQLVMSAK